MTSHDAIPVSREEYEALKRDAARYRWLRDSADVDTTLLHYSGKDFDAAIDAAMEKP